MSDTPETIPDLVRRARARGLDLGDVIEVIRPGVESLAARLRAVGARLTPGDEPPPERLGPPAA